MLADSIIRAQTTRRNNPGDNHLPIYKIGIAVIYSIQFVVGEEGNSYYTIVRELQDMGLWDV
jgi:hypothetical protein